MIKMPERKIQDKADLTTRLVVLKDDIVDHYINLATEKYKEVQPINPYHKELFDSAYWKAVLDILPEIKTEIKKIVDAL